MKKNLLLLGAALLMTASAMAQTYTNPRTKAAPPTFANAATYNYAGETGGDTLYLWNVKYGGFYVNNQNSDRSSGPYWGTRSSVDISVGKKIIFTRQNPNAGESETSTEWGENTYLLLTDVSQYFSTDANGGYRCTFFSDWNAVWTDNNGEQHRHFDVVANGQYLRIFPNSAADISAAAIDPYDVPWDDYGFCVRSEEVDPDRLVFLNRPTETVTTIDETTGEEVTTTYERIADGEEVGLDWAIVSPDVYDAYIESAAEQNTLYKLGGQLAAKLNQAVELTDDGIRPMLDTQIQILNDANATVEQLQQAMEDVSQIVVDYQAASVTPDNPANFTSKINNPDFTNGNLGGWQGGNWGRGGEFQDDCAEHWHATFNHYQDLTGLPEGVYKVVVDGFNRINDNHNDDYVGWKAGQTGHARLYVSCETFGEFETAMMPASAGGDYSPHYDAHPDNDTAYDLGDGNSWYAPNGMGGFVAWLNYWTSQGKRPYGIEAFGALSEGETLRIGARNTVDNEWVIVDNFELWYLGNTLEAYLKWAEGINMPEADPEKYYGQPDLDEYNRVRNNLTNATTKEDVMEAVKGYNDAISALAHSNEIYNQFVSEVDGFDQWLDDNGVDQNTPEAERLGVYMKEVVEPNDPEMEFPNGSAAYILDINGGAYVGTLSAAEMEAELEFIRQMKVAAQSAGMHKGSSLTYLIVNPDFEETPAGKGWTFAYNQTGNQNLRGGEYTLNGKTNHCAEVYESNFDLYQTIEAAEFKPGLYKVTVRAFQRTSGYPGAYENYIAGASQVTTSVYFNEFETPVRDVCSITYDAALSTSTPADADYGTGYCINNMVSASHAFLLDDDTKNFKQEVFGLITPENEGKLTLGIKSEDPNKTAGRWSLWDKFEITYMAKDAAGLKEVITDYLDRDANLVYENICSEELDAWDAAMAATDGYMKKPADANGDNAELYDMLIDLATAYNNCIQSTKIIEQLNTALTELEDYLSDHADEIDPDVYQEIDEWTLQVREEMDPDGTGTTSPDGSSAKFAQYIQDCKDKLQQAKESGINWDEVPVDLTKFIVNPRYNTSNADGWTSTGTAQGFNGSAAEVYQGTFDTYQTVVLPKDGYYRLSVRAFERLGWAAGDYTIYEAGTWPQNTSAYLYAKVGDAIYSHHIKQLATGAVTTEEQSKFSGNWQNVGSDLHVTDNMTGASSFFYYYEDQTRFPENFVEDEQGELVVKDPTAGYYFNEVFFNAPAGEAIIGLTKPERKISGGDWCIWGDWQLWYFGTELPVGINDIQNDNAIAAPVQRSIYTLGGAKLQQMQRGINIVRTVDADGNVKVQKVLVK
jgi:hypothetical protein